MANNNLIFVLSSLAVIFACLSQSSQAYQFIVGGKDGWVLSPSESYSQWAGRNRFSVNDTLFFRYQNGTDSVLVVNKDDYDNCNGGNPILKMDDGNSVFKFDRSGPFYFITGTKENCDKGQKLLTVVLAVRNRPPPPPTATAPSPNGLSSPPVISPSSPPSSETSPPPAASPDQAPSPANQVSGPPPSALSPEANLSPPTPTTTSNTSAPGAGSTPAGGNAPPPPRSFACGPEVGLVVGVVSVVLSLSFGGFVISP
ncbi:early nodulin-like protein 14 [Henckelia pumila]|uniref:early nodulin-like protein 14 n=1 Tax=Henckelia pumila TaxID=405737 RepID=UPI003C6E4701